ncbi:acyl-CoA thioesterase [Ralstonia pseudosolanacearum]|uniref:acyl-CoA thioesterase n=1 Tax=Ralstonia pseudosolanacearum TaxID=1310165 RepID=UPI0008DB0CBA|nr:thioesterase family protein [Ralstonia pseudosolanacearum]MCL1621150.1 thioesterase [Ralstonia pseudosolanacearum CaRs-Mep]MCQ4679301.1 thioesterase [Ralstonia pseudosolanacearum]
MSNPAMANPAPERTVMQHVRPLPYEADFTDFLSNTVAPRWMEALRIQRIRTCFPHFDSGAPQHLCIITETTVRYRKPVRYSDAIVGKAWLQSARYSRWIIAFSFAFEFSGLPAFEGRQAGTFIDPQTHLPLPIPASLRLPADH